MKGILTFTALLSLNLLKAQTGLTSYSTGFPMSDTLAFNYTEIKTSDFTFFFRLNLSGQTIDLYSRDKIKFQGEIINTIKEYEHVKIDDYYRTKASKLYTQITIIEPSLATKIAEQIIESEQLSFPTDTLIKSWERWFLHCGNLNFEIKDNGHYYTQTYHCPWSQKDSVEYKDVILSNYKLIIEELKTDSVYNEFFNQLPKGKTYSSSGYGMTYLMTDEQEDAWNKDQPRRDYLKSIKDRIDNYLTTELEKQNIKLDKISCFEDYRLTFNKDGELWKLKVSNYHKPKLLDGLVSYFEDKREIRKCKKLIRKVFREIDLSSFNLEYNVYRTLSGGLEEKFQLRDDTIY